MTEISVINKIQGFTAVIDEAGISTAEFSAVYKDQRLTIRQRSGADEWRGRDRIPNPGWVDSVPTPSDDQVKADLLAIQKQKRLWIAPSPLLSRHRSQQPKLGLSTGHL